ncbi:MAG: ATP-binding protein [Stagnimonas sp.]|nr:ATP-binding protein [Stagnimonas sp.]
MSIETPWLRFPDETELAEERQRREAESRGKAEQMLEKLSVDLLDRWTELQTEIGAPAPTKPSGPAPATPAPRSAEQVSAVVNTIPDAIVTFGDDGAIRSFNAGAEQMFGYPVAEVLGRNIAELLPGEQAGGGAAELLHFAQSAGDGRKVRELRALRQDGAELVVEVSVGAITVEGSRYGAAVVRDITERKQAERERAHLTESLHRQVQETQAALEELRRTQDRLVQSEKMASLGVLVAGVAHEINTPVGIAVTAASHLLDRIAVLSAAISDGSLKRSQLLDTLATGKQSAELVMSNLSRAAELIHSFKQVAVDQSSPERREVELDVYLQELVASLAPRLKPTPHRLELLCPPGLRLSTVPGALSQVVSNLVLNSLTHAYGEGEAGHLRLLVEREEGGVFLCYADDGRGIAAEVLPKIFDPFFTTRRGSGGSGLGLHIVYNLVTQTLGGRIAVESEPGRGVRFLIHLPTTVTPSPEART